MHQAHAYRLSVGALEVFRFLTEETRSNALAFQGRRVQGVPQRARECEATQGLLDASSGLCSGLVQESV